MSWISDIILGVRQILQAGDPRPLRRALDFVGSGGTSVVVTDDPAEEKTVVTISLPAIEESATVAGAGLTGAGPGTIDVGASDSTIVVETNSIKVGVIADANHGNLSGGALHADAVAGGASGFMPGAALTKLNGIETAADVTDFTNVAAALAAANADIDVNAQKIIDVADPTDPQDASTKAYTDAAATDFDNIAAALHAADATVGFNGESLEDIEQIVLERADLLDSATVDANIGTALADTGMGVLCATAETATANDDAPAPGILWRSSVWVSGAPVDYDYAIRAFRGRFAIGMKVGAGSWTAPISVLASNGTVEIRDNLDIGGLIVLAIASPTVAGEIGMAADGRPEAYVGSARGLAFEDELPPVLDSRQHAFAADSAAGDTTVKTSLGTILVAGDAFPGISVYGTVTAHDTDYATFTFSIERAGSVVHTWTPTTQITGGTGNLADDELHFFAVSPFPAQAGDHAYVEVAKAAGGVQLPAWDAIIQVE